MNNEIGILTVFFGKCPNFINLFINSCKTQSNIDFIFFTDWDWENIDLPTNIIRYQTNLNEFNKLATIKTGINIDVKFGYKLCDMKPAWTHIYEDYLKEYKFVGYCDIDLVFGNIRNFFTNDIADSVDLFTITTTYLSGALTIIKNDAKMRTLYKEAKGWDYIFKDPRHFAFDEFLRIHPSDKDVESYSDLVFRKEKEGAIKVEHSEYIGYEKRPYNKVYYNNGIVLAEGKEYIFFHYVVAKQYAFWVVPDWIQIPNSYYVNKYGFYKDGDRAIRLYDIFFKQFYRKQLQINLRRKINTLKKIIQKMDFKRLWSALIKQIGIK